jgi:hypothetical protein
MSTPVEYYPAKHARAGFGSSCTRCGSQKPRVWVVIEKRVTHYKVMCESCVAKKDEPKEKSKSKR